jgi:hypothetical protein
VPALFSQIDHLAEAYMVKAAQVEANGATISRAALARSMLDRVSNPLTKEAAGAT